MIPIDAEVLRGILRGEIAKAGGLAKLAKSWGCSHSYISGVLSGKETPGPAILRRLRLKRVTMFIPVR